MRSGNEMEYLWGKRVKTRYLQLNSRTEKVIRVLQIVCHNSGNPGRACLQVKYGHSPDPQGVIHLIHGQSEGAGKDSLIYGAISVRKRI